MNKYRELFENNIDVNIKEVDIENTSYIDRYYIFQNLARMHRKDNDFGNYLFCFSASEMIFIITKEIEVIRIRASELMDDLLKPYDLEEKIEIMDNYEQYHNELLGIDKYNKESKIAKIIGPILMGLSALLFIILKFNLWYLIGFNAFVLIFEAFIFPSLHKRLFARKLAKRGETMIECCEEYEKMFSIDKPVLDHINEKYGDLIRARNQEEINRAIMKMPK